jgi:MHS family shikimate/dehydroshikimate transporter-like MFS transporter
VRPPALSKTRDNPGAPGAASARGAVRAVMLASFVGTAIEWYDFFLYGTAAALVFGPLFFPNVDPLTGTLSSFATFAVGFVARPIGGMVFGHFGDRVGRRSMLIYSLMIMGVATFLIGLLPTYATIGVWAPILLVVLRCAQGIGVGGEWGGAVLMAVEHSPPERRGLSGSWPQMGVPAGLFLSTVVFGVVSTSLGEEQFLAWGWRVPFLLSIALIAVGLFIRLKILESPAFVRLQQSGLREARPLVAAVRDYRRNLLLAMGMRVAENGLFYIYTVFVLSYGPAALGVSRATMLWGVTLAALVGLVGIPFFGVWLAIVLAVAVGHSPMYGPQAAYFSELFGARVRYSGASLSYQLASVAAGGLAPFIATALLARWGTPAVAGYMMLLASITVAATYAAPETHRGGLEE